MKTIFLLDMDDTLLDFPRAERQNFSSTLGAFGVRADETLAARFHAINDGLWKALERGEMTRETLKVRRFELLFAEFGIGVPAQEVADAYYDRFAGICFPFEGAVGFLHALRARGRTYILTNGGTAVQEKHIELAGFSEALDGVFISEKIGCNKPSQAYADYVAAHIPGFDAASAVYLGDSLTSDGKCAEAMGVDFVLFAPRGVPCGYRGAAAETYGEALRLMLR